LSAPISLRNKIKAAPSISYIGERRVMYDSISELPAQIHANLGLYYSYSKQLSAYLQLNNLTNSKQDLWLGYREVGFNGVFGVNFSF
jgi:outer membrane receptor protein involved in Fe transport